jgi:peptidoglycan-N-acetylglucosamine deacetylase
MENPVFYDGSGKRHRWTMRVVSALLFFVIATAIFFGITVVETAVPAPLALVMERPHQRPIDTQLSTLTGKVVSLGRWLPAGSTLAHKAVDQIVVGFYVPWEDASRASLVNHIGQMDWLVPGLMSVAGADHKLTVFPDPRLDALLATSPKVPKLLPMIQNALGGKWDHEGTAALFHSPAARRHLLDQLEPMLVERKAIGAVFDFEELPVAAHHDYQRFLIEARARFAKHQWLVVVTVPVDNDEWDLAAYGRIADRTILMLYDEHTNDGEGGPIASQGWFVERMKMALGQVGRDKAIVAVGNYAYDWTGPGKGEPDTIEEAWLIAHDSEAKITFDPASGNPGFAYEEDGVNHIVWFLDAATAWNQLRAADYAGVHGVALWRLGSEDPSTWQALEAFQSGRLPDISTLKSIGDVDVEGNGEILRIESVPTEGHRTLKMDKHELIRDEDYVRFPTPYLIRRTGYKPGLVALTFDDGPDPKWTPQILDILRAKKVPATFFIIGENSMAHPLLLQRVMDEGHEVGSHTFTHPNLALVSEAGTRIELNTTQRLVQAYTGRSMRLFRAPYFGDAEPTTSNELVPARMAQDDGYTNVGLHVDPGDWKTPGVNIIVNETVNQVLSGNADRSEQIVLLHDGGGDREQTVEALPRIIDTLRARGYTFVPVSTLAGLSREAVMPHLSGSDLVAVRTDIGIFLTLAAIGIFLKWTFFLAISIGIARAIMMAALAIMSDREQRKTLPPPIDSERFVSVIIPAFNEARVIAASVRRVLESESVTGEVIVVDDGSTDDTSAIVTSAFKGDARVQLLTLVNSGKANALNRGLALAKGDVVIALDADTQFEAQTIAKLARWFDDPEIGAVAGNAKVGNRVNLVTRWQAVEYVTAQNLERRALSQFDAIMVVPGAVGAWRRSALDAVGGYPVDTLAEDQDLTIAIQRKGWAVAYDPDAVAWTEAPETFRGLSKQRFRWAFGTLQCLWKHGSVVRARTPAGLAYIGIPQAWLFQIVFALISPIIDLALIVNFATTFLHIYQHGLAQAQSDVFRMTLYWLAFSGIDVGCGGIAYRLERREKHFPAFLMIAQRFVYRQLMYSVVIRAVSNALRGPKVGWGKLERSGRMDANPA